MSQPKYTECERRAYLLLRWLAEREDFSFESCAHAEGRESFFEANKDLLPIDMSVAAACDVISSMQKHTGLTPVRFVGAGGQGVVIEAAIPEQRWMVKWFNPMVAGSAEANLERQYDLMAALAAKSRSFPAPVSIAKEREAAVRVLRCPLDDGKLLALVSDVAGAQTLRARPRDPTADGKSGLMLFGGLVDAIEVLHGHSNHVHLDLTPENVLVDAAGMPKLIDLALVRQVTESAGITDSDARGRGTAGYAPPEQLDRSSKAVLDQRADIHALGAILFEVLTGGPLFQEVGEDRATIAARVRRALSDDPRLTQAVLDATEPNPADRPADIAQLRSRLQPAPTLAAVRATPRPSGERLRDAFLTAIDLAPVYQVFALNDEPLFKNSGRAGTQSSYVPLRVGRPAKVEESHAGATRDADGFFHARPSLEEVKVDSLLTEGARWILRGGPGSGKSTFVAHLARVALARKQPLMPLLVSAAAWGKSKDASIPDLIAKSLRQCLPSPGWNDVTAEHLADWMTQTIKDGAALLVLDGWDELGRSEKEAATRLRALLEAGDTKTCPVLVTARDGYATGVSEIDQGPDKTDRSTVSKKSAASTSQLWVLPLQPRDPQTNQWDAELFARLYVPDDQRRCELLKSILEHRDLSELWDVPFILSLVCWLTEPDRARNRKGIELPLRLHEVYDAAIKRLHERACDRWDEDRRARRQKAVSPPLNANQWNKRIEKLAGEWTTKHGRRSIDRASLEELLANPRADVIDGFLYRSRLLQQPGDDVFWLHPTMQEFLAARWIMGTKSDRARRKLIDSIASKRVLHEPLEHLVYFYGAIAGDAERRRVATLLGATLLAAPAAGPSAVPMLRRVVATDVIGRLGSFDDNACFHDPRLSEERRWVTIRSGAFWWGADNRRQNDNLDFEYQIQRWQTTVAEYSEFLSDWDRGGLEAVLEGLRRWGHDSLQFTLELENPEFLLPADAFGIGWRMSSPRFRWNHPIVGVSWSAACLYCAWRTGRDSDQEILTMLPTDMRWEQSARAGSAPPLEPTVELDLALDYPWTDPFGAICAERFGPDLANTSLTGLNSTAAVGAFPRGHSRAGLWDIAGNVWEWCRSSATRTGQLHDDGPERVVRGGCWYTDSPEKNTRCSRRWTRAEFERDPRVGFRPARVSAALLDQFTSGLSRRAQ